jgi:hypothetical protein
MTNTEEFKKRIIEIILQNYKIEFLGEHFDKIVKKLSETKAEKIYRWLTEAVNKKIQPITIGSTKSYKSWKLSELLVFRYPFTIENTKYRILFVKVKNSIYIEFHLGDHEYYDKVRAALTLKKSSY